LLVLVEEDLERGPDQDGAEDGDDPVEAVHQRHAREDQGAAQHDGAEHAPEEHPVLVLGRDREAPEEQHEDEEVVDRERLLQQVAGEELQPLLAPVLEPDEGAETAGSSRPPPAAGWSGWPRSPAASPPGTRRRTAPGTRGTGVPGARPASVAPTR